MTLRNPSASTGLGASAMTGPASSTDSTYARFDGTTGKKLKDGRSTAQLLADMFIGSLTTQTLAALSGAIDLTGATSPKITITTAGPQTITAITAPADSYFFLLLPAGLTLKHNATSLILKGGVDTITEAGDIAEISVSSTGNVRFRDYQRAATGVDFATLLDAQTLSFKTLVQPIISGGLSNGAAALQLPSGPATLVADTTAQTLTNKTLTSPVILTIIDGSGHTLTLPGSTDTLVGRDTTDTLTNKTLTAPVLTSPVIDQISNGAALLQLPSGPTTLASTSTSQTLTNKTLTSPTINGGTVNGASIIGLADPTNAQDAATKAYVDAHATGFSPKDACACATTANITRSGEQTIDGVLTSTSRILVKNQTAPAENGIFVTAAGAWTRATDMDTWAEVPGAFTFVSGGTTQANTGWACTSAAGGTLDTTAITWSQFSAAGTYTAGTGLGLSGTQFSIDSTVVTKTGAQTLTNKTLTAPVIDKINNGAADLQLPAGPATLVADTTSQTLTNKTLTSPTINGGTIADATLTGATMTATGQVKSTNTSLFQFAIDTAAGVSRGYGFKTAASNRWLMQATSLAESGANAGSNFAISNYDDSGVFIGSPISIIRSTGAVIASKVTITPPATGATLTIVDGKTLRANSTLTFAGTDGTTLTFQATGTVVNRDSTDTLTNKTLESPIITNGAATISLPPAAPTTLVGHNTTQTLTGKTYDTAGVGNVFKINGTQVSDVTGTGKAVLDTGGTLTLPIIVTGFSNGANTISLPPAAPTTLVGHNTSQTLTNKTINGPDNTITGLAPTMFASGTQNWKISDTATATVVYTEKHTHHNTSGDPTAAGFGVGMQFEADNTANALKVHGSLDVKWHSATASSEEADAVLNLMRAGTLAQAMRVTSKGYVVDSGTRRVTAQVNKTDATLAALSELVFSVRAGVTYKFRIALHIDANLTGGHKYDLAGGDATATTIMGSHSTTDYGATVGVSGRVSSLSAFTAGQAGIASALTILEGTVVINTGTTFGPRFAQKTASGTSSVLAGSWMELKELA